MKISQTGIDLIKRFEGLELEAYQDIAGIWTIGYGHTGPDVFEGWEISKFEAEELLRVDLVSREKAVNDLVRVPINQNQFDALVSFVYNVGIGALERSTALRELNRGNYLKAAEALTLFNKATVRGVLTPVTGLTRRRLAEQVLFLEPMTGETPNAPEVEDYLVEEITNLEPVEAIKVGWFEFLLRWLKVLKKKGNNYDK